MRFDQPAHCIDLGIGHAGGQSNTTHGYTVMCGTLDHFITGLARGVRVVEDPFELPSSKTGVEFRDQVCERAAGAVAVQSLITKAHEFLGSTAFAGSRHAHHQDDFPIPIRWPCDVAFRLTKRTGRGKVLIELRSIALAQLDCKNPPDGARRGFARCSWNWNDVRRQSEQPGQRNFMRCDAMPFRNLSQHEIPRQPLIAAAAQRTVSNQLYVVIATVLHYAVAQVLVIEHAKAYLHGCDLSNLLCRLDLTDGNVRQAYAADQSLPLKRGQCSNTRL